MLEKPTKNDRTFNQDDRTQNKVVPNHNTSVNSLDQKEVIAHLQALGYQPEDTVFFRFIPVEGEKECKKWQEKCAHLPWSKIAAYQAQGMGAYVVVNGGGQCDRDVKSCRAIFYEHDDLDLATQRELWRSLSLPEPTFQVNTGHRSIHSYWVFTAQIAPDQWRSLQEDLLAFAKADRSLKNPSRVMRLAGCVHPKTGQRSTILPHSGQRYRWEALRAAIPVANPPIPVAQPPQDREQITATRPIPLSRCLTKEHRMWLGMGVEQGGRNCAGAALARDLIGTANRLGQLGQSCTSGPRSLFDQFCQRCRPPLPQLEADRVWRSAEQSCPTPSLPDTAIANCLQAWVREDHTENQPQHKRFGSLPNNRSTLPQPSILAQQWVETYGDRWAFNTDCQTWYCYEAATAGVWSPQPEAVLQGEIQQFLNSVAGANGYSLATVNAVLGLLKGQLYTMDWAAPAGVLPFQNGVLDLTQKELLPHAPGYRLTWTLPRAYTPTANEWPKIQAWLSQVTGQDLHMQHLLLCWLNACLTGRSDLQIYLHLIGPGGSGKGTFIRLATAIVGKVNTHASTLSEWQTNRFEVANAYRKRLIVFPDEDKFKGGLGKFKALTGGDALRAEIKNQQAFSFCYEGMVMLASNFPIAMDMSSGMARRTLLVPFDYPVPVVRRRNLEPEFEPELVALTNYLLAIPNEEVTKTLLQVRSPTPRVVLRSWLERLQKDSIAAWLEECVVAEQAAKTQIGNDKNDVETLFGSYWQYCDLTGSIPKSSREFSPNLLDLCQNILHWNITKQTTNKGKFILGLRLRTGLDSNLPTILATLETAVMDLEASDGLVPSE